MSSEPFERLQLNHEEWLEFRRSHVGGSDVAAIMGISPWRTPAEVWAEKVGLTEPDDIGDRPRVEWGIRLEGLVVDKFAERHGEFRVSTDLGTYVSVDRPWAMATLDARATGLGPQVLEIKTAHYPSSRDWGESGSGASGVPAHYLTQVNHYLAVTGWERANVAVLIDGWDYREYVVERDEADIRAVTEAVDRFWHENVEAMVRPEVTAADADLVLRENSAASDDYAMGDMGALALVDEWRDATSRAKQAKKEADTLATRIKAAIGKARGLEFPEGRVTWTRSVSSRLDTAALRREQPEVYGRYLRQSVNQRLTWKEAKA